MSADADTLDALRPSRLASLTSRPAEANPREKEDRGEESCPAFGFLRGPRDWAPTIEFRFRDGNTLAVPYSWLGPVRFDPSVGLLLKFTGDAVTLVLIRGSNLDAVVHPGAVNLTDRGIYRHRVTVVREMPAGEIRQVGEGGPTIDRIEVAEVETREEQRAWLAEHAPTFLRTPR
jgi:hypothetical protein